MASDRKKAPDAQHIAPDESQNRGPEHKESWTMKLLLQWLGTAAILNVVGHTAGATEPAKAPSEARSIEVVELTSSSEDQGQLQASGRPSPLDRMRERLADPKEAPALR